ncbi:MAG: ATP-binding protein [Salinisphaeraceae bacterium]
MSEKPKQLGRVNLRYGDETAHHCPDHGEFRGRPFTLTGDNWLQPSCPQCEEEHRERLAERDAQAKREAESRRMASSGIPPRFRAATLQNYAAECPGQRRALDVVSRYLDRFEDRRRVGGSLMLLGFTGNGKTHLACALVQALMAAGWHAMYTDIMGMVQAIRSTYGRGMAESEQEAIARYLAPDLLVIDEVGVQYGTDAERALVHHVLDRRYLALRPTLVAGNVDMDGLTAYLGERAVSRLHEANGLAVTFDWDDHRMRRD